MTGLMTNRTKEIEILVSSAEYIAIQRLDFAG